MTFDDTTLTAMKRAYDRQGYTIARGLYDPQEMLHWKQTLQGALSAEVNHASTGVRVWLGATLPGGLIAEMVGERMRRIVGTLLGENVEYLSSKAVFKNDRAAFGSPWHQDWFYWKGSAKLSAWIALDDATPENGCLKVVPGSHGRVWDKREVKEATGFSFRIDEADLAGQPQETLACRRGDAVFFHDLLIHGSHPSTTGSDRWSLIATYRDGSAPDDSTVWPEGLVVSGRSVNPSRPLADVVTA